MKKHGGHHRRGGAFSHFGGELNRLFLHAGELGNALHGIEKGIDSGGKLANKFGNQLQAGPPGMEAGGEIPPEAFAV